jgi:formylglycine-generating enzyme required for sulfatase activity
MKRKITFPIVVLFFITLSCKSLSQIPTADNVLSTPTQEILQPIVTEVQASPTTPPIAEITDDAGVTMVLVPEGGSIMGRNTDEAVAECQKYYSDCNRDLLAEEAPPHHVDLDAYYIDKHEVTNARYKDCVDEGICDLPNQTYSYTRPVYYGNPKFDDFPVIYVNWNQSNAYCQWRGAQLPTEAQWEKAARGIDERTYPWGEEIDCNKTNYYSCIGDTSEVGAYENGKSPYGIYDLAGNVFEWTADWYSKYKDSSLSNPTGPNSGENRILRGGSWNDLEYAVSSTFRIVGAPAESGDYIGFRCARMP